MKVAVVAVGRLGRAPEAALAKDWLERATASGRMLGLGPFEIIEVEAKKSGKTAEAQVLRAAIKPGDFVVACDERGASWTSRGFAGHIEHWRDHEEHRRVVFLIGGADGLDYGLAMEANERIAFGPATWPHALARAMLCEQLYRAVTLLAGSPYHRD